ncbi:hypothetical protein, partial [Prevotellamassilia timonensis]|uniref:hypothetical protein n=1 Tax=Prevotellamassilia timonensis TaxID=1852370 RepID=UPI00307ADC41
CNAHKIRKIRHLRGAKARRMSERIRAIGAIRVLQYQNGFTRQFPLPEWQTSRDNNKDDI